MEMVSPSLHQPLWISLDGSVLEPWFPRAAPLSHVPTLELKLDCVSASSVQHLRGSRVPGALLGAGGFS